MKRFLLALALLLAPAAASAQCNGVFPNGTVCGNSTGAANTPRAINPASLLGAAGGTNGQIQYNNAGALGGFTASGDCTIATPAGTTTCFASGASTGDTLSFNGTNFVHNLITNVINAACTLSPSSCVATFGYARPEWWGAVPSPVGTAAGSIADSTTAIQSALTYLCSIGGGTLQFGMGAYKTIAGITVSCSDTYLVGQGFRGTAIIQAPTVGSTVGIQFSAGAAILSNCGVSKLAIMSPDTTFFKSALVLSDVSVCYARDLLIAHYPQDGTLYRGGGGSQGIWTKGRELTEVKDILVAAELPIRASVNPNSTATEALDSWNFTNITYNNGGTTLAGILFDAGIAPANVRFDGHQNWGGGGFLWSGASGAASFGLTICGVKVEQPNDPTTYAININPGSGLYNLRICDITVDARNGIFIKNVQNTIIENMFYAPPVTNNTALNADVTNLMVQINNSYFGSNAIKSVGLTNQLTITGGAGTSATVPPFAFYK